VGTFLCLLCVPPEEQPPRVVADKGEGVGGKLALFQKVSQTL